MTEPLLTPRQVSQQARRERERQERAAPPETQALIEEIQAGTTTPPAVSPDGADLSQQPVVARPEAATVPSEVDDLSGTVYNEVRDRDLVRMMREIDQARAPAPAQRAVPATQPAPQENDHDRWSIRLLNAAENIPGIGFAGRILPQSTREAIIGGSRDAVVNTARALDSFAEWANQNILDLGGEGAMAEAAETLPEVPESEGVANNLIRGVTQFLAGFIPGLQAVRAAQGAHRVSAMGAFLQAELVGGGAAALVFDPFDDNLANLLEEHLPELSNPVTRYLMIDEDDTESQARIKTALEGAGLGVAAEGMFRILRAAKRYWTEMKAGPTRAELVEEVNFTPDLGDPNGEMLTGGTSNTARADAIRTRQEWLGRVRDPAEPYRTIDDFSQEEIDESIKALEAWVRDDPVYDSIGHPISAPDGKGILTVVKQNNNPQLFEFVHTQRAEEDMLVYRGGNIRDGERLLSTSHGLGTAAQFRKSFGGKTGKAELSEIHIPAGAAALDVNKLLRTAGKSVTAKATAEAESEVLLALGGDWELKFVGKQRRDIYGESVKVNQYELVPSESANKRKLARETNAETRARLTDETTLPPEGNTFKIEDLEKWMNNPSKNMEAPFAVNWARISSEADIDELIDQVATAMRGTIDEARRGRIGDEQLKQLAEALNMTPDQLINRRLGQAFNAEQVVASRAILEASARKLIQMGQQYANSTDPVEMFQLMRMLNTHVAVQAQFRGAAAEAGRALRAYQIPHGSPERRILEIQNQLLANGGPCS